MVPFHMYHLSNIQQLTGLTVTIIIDETDVNNARDLDENLFTNLKLCIFSGFSVGCCINREVICYQLEFRK